VDSEFTERLDAALQLIQEAPGCCYAMTTAPDTYDGFGTATVFILGTDRRGTSWRLVAICPEHWVWQTQRYRSGLHHTVDPAEEPHLKWLREQIR